MLGFWWAYAGVLALGLAAMVGVLSRDIGRYLRAKRQLRRDLEGL